MVATFHELRLLSPARDGVRKGRLDASWYQGRGAFGGLQAALLLDAMIDAVSDEARTPRTLHVHFCAPATEGEVALAPTVVRSGNRVTHATASLALADGSIAAIASASFAKGRDAVAKYARATMPDVEPAERLPPFPEGLPNVPRFFDRLDARFCGGVMPFSGAKEPRLAAWVRLKEGGDAPVDPGLAVVLFDSLPPAVLATFDTPRPLATVDFTIDFFEPLPRAATPPSAHHLLAIRSRWAGDGYAEERRDLWTPDGVLLGQCRQLFALL